MASANFPQKGTHVRRKADGMIGEVYASDPSKDVLTVRWRTATGFLTQVCSSEQLARDWELTGATSEYYSIKLLFVLIGGFIALVFFIHQCDYNFVTGETRAPTSRNGQSSAPFKASQSPDAAAQPQPLQVSAVHLWRDYQRNEISADSMYKGKTLAVKRTVVAINKDFLDQAFLLLDTPNEFERVQAHLQKSEVSKASTLSPGVVVTVNCEGGGMTLGSPMLKDCVIQ